MRKTTNIDSVDIVFIAYKGRKRERGGRWRLKHVINIIFNIADLQGSRRYWDYRY